MHKARLAGSAAFFAFADSGAINGSVLLNVKQSLKIIQFAIAKSKSRMFKNPLFSQEGYLELFIFFDWLGSKPIPG